MHGGLTMRRGRRSTRLAGTWMVLTFSLPLGGSGCGEETCLCDAAGAGGAAGVSGSGGGGGVGGVGGSGGVGPGGSGGSDACASDGACAAAGSLCVKQACTEPSATCTKATLVVVPDATFVGELAADLAGACFYRALGPALAAAAANAGATTRVLVYAAVVVGPAAVPPGVRLEGRATALATLVALTAGGGVAGAGGAGGSAGSAGAAGAGGAVALVTL